MGGRAASGLQREYGHVGSTPDLMGGLGLIAGTCSQSDKSGSVYVPALSCSEEDRLSHMDDRCKRSPETLPLSALADLRFMICDLLNCP